MKPTFINKREAVIPAHVLVFLSVLALHLSFLCLFSLCLCVCSPFTFLHLAPSNCFFFHGIFLFIVSMSLMFSLHCPSLSISVSLTPCPLLNWKSISEAVSKPPLHYNSKCSVIGPFPVGTQERSLKSENLIALGKINFPGIRDISACGEVSE